MDRSWMYVILPDPNAYQQSKKKRQFYITGTLSNIAPEEPSKQTSKDSAPVKPPKQNVQVMCVLLTPMNVLTTP